MSRNWFPVALCGASAAALVASLHSTGLTGVLTAAAALALAGYAAYGAGKDYFE